ncbi:hypothetical protein Ddye_003904 [Dipteronia dyeriana]|uniref:Uncharacterized protein n=1 Tax=Dipteronia dyeriana TaxID=168575 RepID=A0AAD9XTW7_9ROSI|nr:hypothetical protein Ddye_003904 [Dipteronia dyeriana]
MVVFTVVPIHGDKTTFICSFDLEKEQFQPFPGPPIQDHGLYRPVNNISVAVSRDLLAYNVKSKQRYQKRENRKLGIQSNYKVIPYIASLLSIKDDVMRVRVRSQIKQFS